MFPPARPDPSLRFRALATARNALRAPAILAAVLALQACGAGLPDIDVATSLDLGTVVKGGEAVADVPVHNVGDGPLTVLAVSTSCGCTRATLTPSKIPAGGTGTLHIVYDSGAHEADRGLIERFVFVSSDDPDEDDVQIRFEVRVSEAPS